MEVLLYLGIPTKNEHDNFSCPQKFIAYPQPHEILKCPFKKTTHVVFLTSWLSRNVLMRKRMYLALEVLPDQQSFVDFHACHFQSSQILLQQS